MTSNRSNSSTIRKMGCSRFGRRDFHGGVQHRSTIKRGIWNTGDHNCGNGPFGPAQTVAIMSLAGTFLIALPCCTQPWKSLRPILLRPILRRVKTTGSRQLTAAAADWLAGWLLVLVLVLLLAGWLAGAGAAAGAAAGCHCNC